MMVDDGGTGGPGGRTIRGRFGVSRFPYFFRRDLRRTSGRIRIRSFARDPIAVPSLTVSPITVPSITVPSLTVPSITVPSLTAPSLTVSLRSRSLRSRCLLRAVSRSSVSGSLTPSLPVPFWFPSDFLLVPLRFPFGSLLVLVPSFYCVRFPHSIRSVSFIPFLFCDDFIVRRTNSMPKNQ